MNESGDSEPGGTDPASSDAAPAQPVAADPASKPSGTVYRSSRRPGLTPPGVAVIGSTVSLLAAILSWLITDGIGWVFGVPFVLVSAYCAWEVRGDKLRSALIMPPLALLLVAVVVPTLFGEVSGLRDGASETLLELTKLAPMLFVAVGVSGAILAWRRWGRSESS